MNRQRRGPFRAGEQVQLTDPKGRRHLILLQEGRSFHTHHGVLSHDEIIGREEGSVVRASSGVPYIAVRPLLADYTVGMRRGAAVVYPKDAAHVVAFADLFPGARVLEAGAGSGALTCWLLRAVGERGLVVSFERRSDFAEIARRNVELFFGGPHPAWRLIVGEFRDGAGQAGGEPAASTDADRVTAVGGETPNRTAFPVGAVDEPIDRVILDMLAPWECVGAAAEALTPGGVICCYVATTTQLARTVEALRERACFTEPVAWETLMREWHVEGLAVRPEQRMVGHTGFLVTARRLADGVTPPPRRRRPAKGAYPDDTAG